MFPAPKSVTLILIVNIKVYVGKLKESMIPIEPANRCWLYLIYDIAKYGSI